MTQQLFINLYAQAIALFYPKRFSKHYQRQMVQTYRDMLDDDKGAIKNILTSLTVFAELPVNAYSERLKAKGAKLHQNPARSFRRLAVVCILILILLLVLPVSMALMPNSDFLHIIADSNIQVFAFYIFPALTITILVNNLVAWIMYKSKRYNQKSFPYLKDFKRTWPVYGALSVSVLVVSFATVGTYQSISDKAVAMSGKEQQAKSSQACAVFSLDLAKKYIGSDIIMNNARSQEKNAEPTYDSILFEDNDIVVSSCNYVQKSPTASKNMSLVVGARDSKNEASRKSQQKGFFTNIVDGEMPISVGDFKGFYLPHDKTVGLRLWASERWIEVNAPSLDIAIPVAKEMVRNIQ